MISDRFMEVISWFMEVMLVASRDGTNVPFFLQNQQFSFNGKQRIIMKKFGGKSLAFKFYEQSCGHVYHTNASFWSV